MAQPFIGEIRMFGFNYPPRGWSYCNGGLMPISENSALFSILGTTFGGDGRTTFGLPNLQCRAPIHPGYVQGMQYQYTRGGTGGAPHMDLTQQQIPAHTHSFTAIQAVGETNDPEGSYPAGHKDDRFGKVYNDAQLPLDAAFSTSAVHVNNGGNYHENRQPFLVVNFCIATMGLYPSRN